MSRDPQEPVGPNHSVGRYARVIALETPSLDSAQYVEGARYDEVQLARQCKLVEHNRYACSIKTLDQIVRSNSIEHYSIILIPNLLSAEECEMLVREVESEHEKRIQAAPAGALRGRMSSKNPALHERYPINNLSEAAQRVFDTAFFKRYAQYMCMHTCMHTFMHAGCSCSSRPRSVRMFQRMLDIPSNARSNVPSIVPFRLLPFVSAELPSVAAAIWAQSYKMGLPRDGFASDTPLDRYVCTIECSFAHPIECSIARSIECSIECSILCWIECMIGSPIKCSHQCALQIPRSRACHQSLRGRWPILPAQAHAHPCMLTSICPYSLLSLTVIF